MIYTGKIFFSSVCQLVKQTKHIVLPNIDDANNWNREKFKKTLPILNRKYFIFSMTFNNRERERMEFKKIDFVY